MSFLDAYKHKILYGALVLGVAAYLIDNCKDCSCHGGRMERFPPREAQFYQGGEAFRTQEVFELGVENSLERKIEL